ncbi:MAG: hypothetical protein ACOYLB_09830 [Phototrophicaceae bacterium]
MKNIHFSLLIWCGWLAIAPMVFAQTESTPTDFGLSPFPMLYNTQLELSPTPLDFPAEFGQLPQHIEILGVHVFATASIPSETVFGYAATFANLIDSNQDGVADNEGVWLRLVEGRTALLLVSASDPITTLHPILEVVSEATQSGQAYILQPIFVTDVNLSTPPAEAVFAMLRPMMLGYGMEYPQAFGMNDSSSLALALQTAQANGHYLPPMCSSACVSSRYAQWGWLTLMSEGGVTSNAEWTLTDRATLATVDPSLYALLSDPQYGFAQSYPMASYQVE